MLIEEILQEIVVLSKQYSASKVILFGSRAKGTAVKTSDIDIAVSGVSDIDELRAKIEEIPTENGVHYDLHSNT